MITSFLKSAALFVAVAGVTALVSLPVLSGNFRPVLPTNGDPVVVVFGTGLFLLVNRWRAQ